MARQIDWTNRDLLILRAEFPKRTTKEVAAMLGRSVDAVSVKASLLGLRKTKPAGIEWSPEMIRTLRTYFPRMFNRDLARMLKVSPRTMSRKAAELGLEKAPDFREKKQKEISHRASVGLRACGPVQSRFRKGEHVNPAGEFKAGHIESPETKAKRSEALKATWKRKKLLNKYGL